MVLSIKYVKTREEIDVEVANMTSGLSQSALTLKQLINLLNKRKRAALKLTKLILEHFEHNDGGEFTAQLLSCNK